jgi:hypothetical protein
MYSTAVHRCDQARIDKAYGIKKLWGILGISLPEMIYVAMFCSKEEMITRQKSRCRFNPRTGPNRYEKRYQAIIAC